MSSSSTGGSRQRELFSISTTPTISVDPNHRLVQLTHELDWTTLEEKVQQIRRQKLKSRAGRKPRLRALIGAVVLMGVRKVGYREAEDLIRNYAPARYLCGLTESNWSPDFTTIQDFTQLLGSEGMELLNQHTVQQAVQEKLADPKVIVADTTAQEAPIGHPNEMGLMSAFMTAVVAASRKLTGIAPGLYQKMLGAWERGKKKLRSYRLFAKTKEAKNKLMAQMAGLVDRARRQLTRAMEAAAEKKDRLVKSGKRAWSKLERLGQTMARLLPQIRSWLKTGKVATGKIISVHMPELYAIVRGKVGKAVEFGLRWGLTRLRGGFLLAKVALNRLDLQDSKYAVQAVDDHIALFGKAPRAYAYDRGGYSKSNIKEIKQKGVKQVALAPRGKARWPVGGRVKKRLIKERAQIEGGIGALKSGRYGFHRPAARSAEMMATCGQRAVLGLNLNKLVRGLAHRKKVVLVG